MHDELDARVTELECRMTLQDDLIESLEQQLRAQGEELATLRQIVAEQRQWLKGMLPPGIAASGEEAPPPHY